LEEYKFVEQSRADMLIGIPVVILFLTPFIGDIVFLMPWFAPSFLPSTFHSAEMVENHRRQMHERRTLLRGSLLRNYQRRMDDEERELLEQLIDQKITPGGIQRLSTVFEKKFPLQSLNHTVGGT
jgi:hypothetical protein